MQKVTVQNLAQKHFMKTPDRSIRPYPKFGFQTAKGNASENLPKKIPLKKSLSRRTVFGSLKRTSLTPKSPGDALACSFGPKFRISETLKMEINNQNHEIDNEEWARDLIEFQTFLCSPGLNLKLFNSLHFFQPPKRETKLSKLLQVRCSPSGGI